MRRASPVDAERRARLLAAKLRALVKRHWPDAGGVEPKPAAGGMAVLDDDRAWALVDDEDPRRGFARALLWGLHRRVAELHVLVDRGPDLGGVARQAGCFRTPVTVWEVSGSELGRVDPTPLPPEPPLDPRAEPFIPVIESAGAAPVVEWGVLTAEVLGLQVGRVCTDADGAWLEVGVSEYDRLGYRLLWGDEPPPQTLSGVVKAVLEVRRSGDPVHPLNQLGRERWLRHRVVHHPSLVDARQLEPIAPPTPQGDLAVPRLAPTKGADEDRGDLLAACSVGFDPTFVPMAAELHAGRVEPGTKLVLVLPEGDGHPLTRSAAADTRAGASFRTVPKEWYRERPG